MNPVGLRRHDQVSKRTEVRPNVRVLEALLPAVQDTKGGERLPVRRQGREEDEVRQYLNGHILNVFDRVNSIR